MGRRARDIPKMVTRVAAADSEQRSENEWQVIGLTMAQRLLWIQDWQKRAGLEAADAGKFNSLAAGQVNELE